VFWGRHIFFKSLLMVMIFLGTGSSAGAGSGDPIGERFQGEVLKYDIGFWIFDRLGEGVATFRSLGDGKYAAFHEGRTLGFIRWISRNRRDVYRSTMGTINNGRRLIPFRFEEDVIIGQKVRKRITVYDYAAKKVTIETQQVGTIYDDPMTAFYNFRFGVYGKVEPGKEFIIRTVPREESRKTIRLTVASKEEEERRRAAEVEKEGKDLLIKVHLDKELVGSLHGEVEVWFRKDIIPMTGVAKDVFFYGDIKGQLTYQGFSNSPEKFDVPSASEFKDSGLIGSR
jgi:hypothetical protein